MKSKYHTVTEMLYMIDEPNQSACWKIFEKNCKLFRAVQGSTNNHQNWPGGYYDHVREVMNVAIDLYAFLNSHRPLPFSLSDLLLVLFLHDIEKPWKYELHDDGKLYHKQNMQTKEEHQSFRMKKLGEFGVFLTPEQENGIKYVEGEHDDYSNQQRVMGPLACVAHMCDVASARLWFNHPSKKDDPWTGASRVHN